MRVNKDTEKYIGKFGVFLKSKNPDEQDNVLLYDKSIMPALYSIYSHYALEKRELKESKVIYFIRETRMDTVEPERTYYAQRNDHHVGLVKGEYLDNFLLTKDRTTRSIAIVDIEILPVFMDKEHVLFVVPTMNLVTGRMYNDSHQLSRRFLKSCGEKASKLLPYTSEWVHDYEDSIRRGIPVTGYRDGRGREDGLGLTASVGDLL